MAVEVKVPTVGESVTEGTLARWLKKDGEPVAEGDPLFELETDKATGEVPAPATGVLRTQSKEGDTVAVGAVVGRIEPGDGKAVKPAEKPKTPIAEERRPAPKSPAPEATPAAAAPPGVAPKKAAEPPAVPIPQEEKPVSIRATDREERRPMSRLRRTIAERLVSAQHTAAILTTFNEADMSRVLDIRGRLKDVFKERHGVGLGFMSFFVKAVVEALRTLPVVGARIEGDDVVYSKHIDIGVAVSTERGLLVPVLRDADRLTFARIEQAIQDLATRAREGRIGVDELRGGVFTITNGGVFGSLLSTPILNPPQSAILGMHTIQKRPVVVNDQIVIRPMMYLALSYDHRLIDGREAVQFLVRIKECIEDPERLVLGA